MIACWFLRFVVNITMALYAHVFSINYNYCLTDEGCGIGMLMDELTGMCRPHYCSKMFSLLVSKQYYSHALCRIHYRRHSSFCW